MSKKTSKRNQDEPESGNKKQKIDLNPSQIYSTFKTVMKPVLPVMIMWKRKTEWKSFFRMMKLHIMISVIFFLLTMFLKLILIFDDESNEFSMGLKTKLNVVLLFQKVCQSS